MSKHAGSVFLDSSSGRGEGRGGFLVASLGPTAHSHTRNTNTPHPSSNVGDILDDCRWMHDEVFYVALACQVAVS